MTGKKQVKIAKAWYKKSLTNDSVDAKKVSFNLQQIVKQKPARLTSILRTYKHLIESALSKEEVIVESATIISNQKQLEHSLIEKTGARKVVYKLNPDIVIGAKIIHGDWIYDATLEGKLGQLTIDPSINSGHPERSRSIDN